MYHTTLHPPLFLTRHHYTARCPKTNKAYRSTIKNILSVSHRNELVCPLRSPSWVKATETNHIGQGHQTSAQHVLADKSTPNNPTVTYTIYFKSHTLTLIITVTPDRLSCWPVYVQRQLWAGRHHSGLSASRLLECLLHIVLEPTSCAITLKRQPDSSMLVPVWQVQNHWMTWQKFSLWLTWRREHPQTPW